MTVANPFAAQPEKEQKPGLITRIRQRLRLLSVPTRAALCMALFLLGLVVAVWTVFLFDPTYVPWRHSLSITHVFFVAILGIAIPFTVRKVAKLWLEGEPSRHPDIDAAWNAGLDALRASHIPINDLPIFLILGVPSQGIERSVFDAAGITLKMKGVPNGSAPLHWYASSNAIYLACSEVGSASLFASMTHKRAELIRSSGGNANTALQDRILKNLENQDESENETDSAATLNIGAFLKLDAAPPSASDNNAELPPIQLPHQEQLEAAYRLEYTCRLLRNYRQPLCPLNGALILAPIESTHHSLEESEQLRNALRSDLEVMNAALQLKFPISVVAIGLENQRGFLELVRRVGPQRSKMHRFGHGFNVNSSPSPEQVGAFTHHACGAFEDWIYFLFREEDALSHPGNAQLLGLLCKIRSRIQPRLQNILVGSMSVDVKQGHPDDAPLFAGCYFSAVGASGDRQGFMSAVFQKLEDEQEQIAWRRDATREGRRNYLLSMVGSACCVVLLVLPVVGIVLKKL